MNLPFDITALIIPDWATSAALALVNRHYNDVVSPILYKDITLNGGKALKTFSKTMTDGRPTLRQYPKFLRIMYCPPPWEGNNATPDFLKSAMKKILMHTPNLSYLNLDIDEWTTQYLMDDPWYPFKLRWFEITPTRDATFVEFLRTQPEIEKVTFWPSFPEVENWSVVTGPLQPDILPKLRIIESNKADTSFLIPHHPATEVVLYGILQDFEVHKEIAKSLGPLKSLTECIEIQQQRWEFGIVTQCLPSLEFCWHSLSQYSLDLQSVRYRRRKHSIITLLQASLICSRLMSMLSLSLQNTDTPSHGFEAIRNGLSMFNVLKKFSLKLYHWKTTDLTPEFCETVPELSRFEVWKESCPSLEEVTLFGVTLKDV